MKSSFSNIEDVWKYLDKIPKFQDKGATASNFELENITKFCELIGNPQNDFPSIHVAGTNGKGTTCYLLEEVYKNSGHKMGLFTSPHLIRYNERFRINGIEVEDSMILEFFQCFEEELQKVKLTYFEISTALSFWLFSEEKVNLAIIETGLGGRLDSTNIINSELSIITSIGIDHQDILGSTEKEIAKEKAGIIKSNKPVILGNISDSNEAVIAEIASERVSPLFRSKDISPKMEQGRFISKIGSFDFKTNFFEEVNKWNVASVYLATQVLNGSFPISKNDFIESAANFKGAPARFEKLHENKEWYFSGAHNVQALGSTLETVNKLSDKPIIVFSIMKDKLNEEVLSMVNRYKKKYYYALDSERAASYSDIQQVIDAKNIAETTYKTILKEFDTSLVIFTGSFYFYSTVKRWVNKF